MAARKSRFEGVDSPYRALQTAQLKKEVYAWVKTYMGQMALSINEPSEGDGNPEGDNDLGSDVTLLISGLDRNAVLLNWTSLTQQEFLAVKLFFTTLFDLVEPIILARDEAAQNAWDSGDDSFSRSYRQVPQLTFREGALARNYKGIRYGLKNAAAGLSSQPNSDGGLRGSGNDLAAEKQDNFEPEDDSQKAF